MNKLVNKLKSVITKLFKKYVAKTHKYPAGCLIHRRTNSVIFEIEFNWYDEDLEPVSVVREVKSSKIFSVRYLEMLEFVEYSGSDPNPGQ
jgi:hypothetical protein